jgi:hypothetical protein
MHKTPDLETVSPAIFWREAARRLKLVDHERPRCEVDGDEGFLGLRLQHELDFAASKSAPILTRFLVLFDDELYRLLLAYAEHRLDDKEKRLVEQLGEAFPGIYAMIEHLTSRELIADEPPREDVMEMLRHGALRDIDDDDEAIAEERLF